MGSPLHGGRRTGSWRTTRRRGLMNVGPVRRIDDHHVGHDVGEDDGAVTVAEVHLFPSADHSKPNIATFIQAIDVVSIMEDLHEPRDTLHLCGCHQNPAFASGPPVRRCSAPESATGAPPCGFGAAGGGGALNPKSKLDAEACC